jgi:hypothetical protein
MQTGSMNEFGPIGVLTRVEHLRGLGVMTAIFIVSAACGNQPVESGSATSTPAKTTAPAARGPTEPGDTAWFKLVRYATGVTTATGGDPVGDAPSGHMFVAGTLDAGQTVRLELPDDHAFADGPRDGRIVVGADDGTTSEVQLVEADSGGVTPVVATDQIVWGGTVSPDGTAVYYVPVDRGSMTDAGLWRLDIGADGADVEAEQVLGEFATETYDFASEVRFAWSPDGASFVGQYCERGRCQAQIVQPGSGDSRLHDEPGVFELRGMTEDVYVADAFAGQRSGILAVDLDTLDVRVLSEEWGGSEIHHTADGPVVVYFAPDQPTRQVALVGIWLDRDESPFLVYDDRTTDTPPEWDFHPLGTGYEAPDGWMLLWPGSPGPDPDASRERTFLLVDVLGGEELTFPYDADW